MIKNYTALVAIVLMPLLVSAQEFKPFKVDVGLSFNTPFGDAAGNGAGGYIEPRYGVNDEFTLGLRLEWSALSSGNITVNTQMIDVSSAAVRSTMFVGEYFFNTANVRPFVGAGIGFYRRESYGVRVNLGQVQTGDLNGSVTNFGFAPRIGLNAGHFRLSTIFNFTGKNISDYFGLNVGFEFGGGRQKGL